MEESEMKSFPSKDITDKMSGLDTEKIYISFNEIIKNMPGLNIKQLGEKLDIKPEIVEHLIWCVNEYPCTFTGYGPYVKINGRYYLQGKDNTIKSLEAENKELKEKIKELEKKVSGVKS